MPDHQIDVDPNYDWAINQLPDYIVVQPAPLAVRGNTSAIDGIREMFTGFGFVPYSDADLPLVGDEVLFATTSHHGKLVITLPNGVSDGWDIPHEEPEWARRVRNAGEVGVLITQGALDSGKLDQSRLDRDVAAGGVLKARVSVQ